jgi:hypothetical protein
MPLRIEVPVSQAALDGWMDRLAVGAPVRVNVGRIQPPSNRWSLARGRLPIKRLAKLSPELARAHAQRMKPIVVRDPKLGRLVLERELGWYRGKYAIADRRVRLSICQSAPNNDAAADARDIAAARATRLALSRGFTACERAIVKKMLPLYNRIWRGDRPVLAGAKLLDASASSSMPS